MKRASEWVEKIYKPALKACYDDLEDLLYALVAGAGISIDRINITFNQGEWLVYVDGEPLYKQKLEITLQTEKEGN